MHRMISHCLKKSQEVTMETIVPHLKEILGHFPVVILQTPFNVCSFLASSSLAGYLLVHLTGRLLIPGALLCLVWSTARPSLYPWKEGSSAILSIYFFRLDLHSLVEHDSNLFENIFIMRSKILNRHSIWPSCTDYYCQLLVNKARKRPLEGSMHFQLVLEDPAVFLISLIFMEPDVQKLCIKYVHEPQNL